MGIEGREKFSWKDTNVGLFGSDADKKIKKESAETEPAWKGVGNKTGLRQWRINRMKVEKCPPEEYGKFYSGDSYIILRTFKEEGNEELKYDVHFWIGKYSTQDEFGTAAYKTVELDTFLDDKAIQHREVQGNESELFKSYFDFFTIMKGGYDSGFNRVTPQSYKTRLFHIVGEKKQIAVNEIGLKRGNLNSEDVFVVDCGLRIYQFNGETANKDEKFRATQYVNQMRSERMGKPRLDILEEKSISPKHPMYKRLPDGASKEKGDSAENQAEMLKVTDSTGHRTSIKEICKGLDKSKLDSSDVIVCSSPSQLFVWIGKGASIDERRNCLAYAHSYLTEVNNPYVPVTVLKEGEETKEFNEIF